MIKLNHPTKPESFESDPDIVAARVKIRAMVEKADEELRKGTPLDKAGYPSSKDFEDLWSDFKKHFEQESPKCVFCEFKPLVTGYGTVDHYRPKTQVDVRVTSGKTKFKRKHYPGYWWLAYSWDNWIYSCFNCNTSSKRCQFPLAQPEPQFQEHCEQAEEPLLLNPYQDQPEDHLCYTETGKIEATLVKGVASQKGSQTIAVCDLNRKALLDERKSYAATLLALIEYLPGTKQRLIELCEAHENFTGMARYLLQSYSTDPVVTQDSPLQ